MANGLRLKDAAGNVILDTSDGIFTYLGTASYNLSTSFYSGSFSHGDFAKGTPAYFIVSVPVDNTYGSSLTTHITFSGTTCNWSADASSYGLGSPDQSGTLTFHYGYF